MAKSIRFDLTKSEAGTNGRVSVQMLVGCKEVQMEDADGQKERRLEARADVKKGGHEEGRLQGRAVTRKGCCEEGQM